MNLKHIVPFGILEREKPRHYREMFQVLVENIDALSYAHRILTHGVCDGCSLGAQGLHDHTMEGIHLCTTRLRLLRVNTMPPAGDSLLAPIEELQKLSGTELMNLGRISFPMFRRRGDKSFSRITWKDALSIAAEAYRKLNPEETAWYMTSRGLYNEAYYVFQKVARVFGSPHVDNAARLCHAPSTIGLAETLGVAAPTCLLKDLIGTDLIVLWGTNLANNQPVATKYLYLAKKAETRVVVVNPYREPGLARYWIPSVAGSALFGTPLMDDFYQVRIGGDIAFMYGILKIMDEKRYFDSNFINEHTIGFEQMLEVVRRAEWKEIEQISGLKMADCERFAGAYGKAKTAVFVWSMGLTQHKFGVENVRAICTLALTRGMVGREKCGLLPIRGHSGVQGGAECGAVPNKFPSGIPINEDSAALFERIWGKKPPVKVGFAAPEMINGANDGTIKALYCMGGNFSDTLPDPAFVANALSKLQIRMHQDVTLNHSMLIESESVLILPAMTRYETPGGVTQTSTERRIAFSPEIAGPRIPETKPEWQIPVLLACAVDPQLEKYFPYKDTADIRAEMEIAVPMYAGIKNLRKEGDDFVWGGDMLCAGWKFKATADGKARLLLPDIVRRTVGVSEYLLTTRRGKQFNSMVFEPNDPLTGGTPRNAVFLCAADARREGLAEGSQAIVESAFGKMNSVVKIADIAPGTVQMFWPECNPLIPRELDPLSKEPDYNVNIRISKPSLL